MFQKFNPPTRRAFLKTGAAAVAGLSALGEVRAGPATTQTTLPKKVRMGIVGGNFGTQFQWHEHPECVVEAVSDLRPERRDRLAKVYRCPKTYESLEKLITDPAIDAVAVFTPAPDHVRHVTAALNAGKHVMCAVPAAMTLEECQLLRDTVKQTGLTYMMAETSYYRQPTISARKFWKEKRFGNIYCTEAEYHHAGLEALFMEGNERTWRYGFPPMHYPTHCVAFLVGVTGERLTSVSCLGWGDDSPMLKDNAYKNPFWNETAFFKTDKGNAMKVAVWWKGAHRGTERATWFGDKMSFHCPTPDGQAATIVRAGKQSEKDDAGFERQLPEFEVYKQPAWWKTDLLPEPLRHDSGHDGSHTFLTHEFIDALQNGRRPTVDVYAALACTVPGIVAHQSALKAGEQMAVPGFDEA